MGVKADEAIQEKLGSLSADLKDTIESKGLSIKKSKP